MKWIGVCTPAWSLPSGRKNLNSTKEEEQTTPGPDVYSINKADPKVYETAPKYTLRSKSGAGIFLESKVPGPGTYEIKDGMPKLEKKSSKKLPVPKDRGQIVKDDQGLGPGSYNHNKLTRSAPKFSFGYKFDTLDTPDTESKKNLGPGLYNPSFSHKEFTPVRSFYKAKRKGPEDFRSTCAPGPGHYFFPENLSAMSYTSRKGTFGSCKTLPKKYNNQDEKNGTVQYDKDYNTI